jgi:Cyclin D1 binding domain
MSSTLELNPNHFLRTNAHCKREISFHEKLVDAQSVWLFEVICFLDPIDASNYGATCKLARHLLCNNYLWSFFGTRFLASLQSPARAQEFVKEAISALQFPDPKSLYLCLHKAKGSLIGWYRIVPYREDDLSVRTHFCRGGLVCMRLGKITDCSRETVVLEIIDPTGQSLCRMSITCSGDGQSLECRVNKRRLFSLEFCGTGGIKLKGVSQNVNYLLQPLPNNFQKSKSDKSALLRSTICGHVNSITGLFVARYGSHGLELLHISLVENDERVLEGSDSLNSDLKELFYVVNGLKVTGDPNVPAAQLSFTVDVTHTKDFYSWINADTRPVIVFSEDGVTNVTLMSERQNNIRAAYRGKGQINRVPDLWDPEWVDLTLVIYTDSSVANGSSFSIVWDDIGETYRHLMDFVPFLGQNYPPIEPPLNWSSTKFDYVDAERG